MDQSDAAVAAVAAGQHGVFGLDQYVAVGGSRSRALRRCAWGVWDQRNHSVFRIAGSPATIEQRLMEAVLDGGPGAMVSHRAAAWLRGLSIRGGVPIELTVPRARVRPARGVIWHRSRDAHLAGVEILRGLPVTGTARTVLDLGAVDPSLVRPAMWDFMRSRRLSWPEVLGTLVDHSRRGRPGLGALRRVVDEHYWQVVGDSRTEDRAFEILADSGRVPLPERLVPVICADGVTVTPDFLWPAFGLILEIYGADHLLNESVQQIDAHRINQLEIAGFATLIYTGKMLRSPDRLICDVDSMLRSRGWSGELVM